MGVKLILRSPQFAARLTAACDENEVCPPLHRGRLVWLKQRLAERKIVVTVESVRRWLSGEGRPRQDKCWALADVLGVDPVKLYTGNTSQNVLNNQGEGDTPASIAPITPALTVLLRPDVTVSVMGMPLDLTAAEASRLANVIRAFAEVNG